MSGNELPMSGEPAKHWMFRNFVSIVQLVIVILLVGLAVWWALSDGNGERVWESFYHFSQGIVRWSHDHLRYPWE
ncbi:MAG: hypothetical protein ACTIB7_06100 [Brevibacterium aurantiacum]|uniref:Amino acid ABC transporter permease n=1 Tax=Brevibacterium aurantiacum TaxID=273384 RepID=A0A2A3YNY0_BREAU|nr:hypothetical protein [Brevibacterium aurantiacum]MDN5585781.1 hypothetical protein [Brevibacterium sp.]MDN5662018.1 hypothetical protein [Brevibacterium aurantiacum]PCC41472.1 hypothetical protein CIK65_17415 [Brevibacterium aurantiacum]SMX94895.1 hypothetical protein BAUR920_02819 [Brevibacterium aurantiacum]